MNDLMDVLQRGRENAIPRDRLAYRLCTSDRAARREIQKARDDGALILNAGDGRGYYLAGADDLDELERQYKQDTARAMAILKRRKKMRRILKEAGRSV